jgi:predicted helicase
MDMRVKIFYFTLQDEQTKEEKLDWFEQTRFDHITPDQKANWINLTDNDFDSFLPLIDKEVKAGNSQEAVFQLFSRGVETTRDEWVYDLDRNTLTQKMQFFTQIYNSCLNKQKKDDQIKWNSSLEDFASSGIKSNFNESYIQTALYRPFCKALHYTEKIFNHRLTQNHYDMFSPDLASKNKTIIVTNHTQVPFLVQCTDSIPTLDAGGRPSQCLPLYRYDENGSRIDNITDWGLTQFQSHYNDPTISKEAIFHYTYAVLHHPAYRSQYEINLKREFPRLPFYADFQQWASWGKELMDLHLNYEAIEPYGLRRVDVGYKTSTSDSPIQGSLIPTDKSDSTECTTPKAKLKADKTEGKIILDTVTILEGVPAIAWEYKLGNRSALEWILDQYKEKKPKDSTIAKLFNTYKFADYKEQVIDLLDRVCTVSIKTMEIIQQMPDTVEHQSSN